jgi:hypothetical protein
VLLKRPGALCGVNGAPCALVDPLSAKVDCRDVGLCLEERVGEASADQQNVVLWEPAPRLHGTFKVRTHPDECARVADGALKVCLRPQLVHVPETTGRYVSIFQHCEMLAR